MSQYRRLFLIADPSMMHTPAFERAGWLAQSTGASLHICLFDYSQAIASVALVDKEQAARARASHIHIREQWLAEEATVLRGRGVQVTTEVCWAHPLCEEMLAHVLELVPDIVIKDAHLEPLLKRVLMTPLDWQLLRQCTAPLLLVNSTAHKIPRRIIAAVDLRLMEQDGPDLNDAIIHAALQLAIQCDAQLHLVHAYDGALAVPPAASLESPVITADLYETLLATQRQAFTALADAHGVPPDQRHFLIGPPAAIVAAFAKASDTDIIVLGTTHRVGMERLLMGSTAENILFYLPCSVLAIPPETGVDALARDLAAANSHAEAHGTA